MDFVSFVSGVERALRLGSKTVTGTRDRGAGAYKTLLFFPEPQGFRASE